MSETQTAPVVENNNTSEAPETEAVEQTSNENKLENVQPEGSLNKDKVEKKIEEKKAEEKKEKQLRKLKLKVHGREIEDEIDLNDDAELTKRLQKAYAADHNMQQAAEVRKAALQFIEELKKNPRKVLADPNIGIDVKKFAYEIMNEELAEQEKSPEQREKEALMRKVQDLEEKAKQREEFAKQAELQRLQTEQERVIEADITAALDVGGIPKTPRTVARMADMMMIALNNGIDLSAKDIAPYVKDNTLSEFKEIVSSLSDDQLEDFLGKEVLGRLRKKNVAKAKAPTTASQIKATGQDSKPKEEKPAAKIPLRKFFGI